MGGVLNRGAVGMSKVNEGNESSPFFSFFLVWLFLWGEGVCTR